MTKNRLFIAFCLVWGFVPVVFGQNIVPAIEWQKCYGGEWGDIAKTIIATSDGGYIFLAQSSSINSRGDLRGVPGHGNSSEFWVVKLTPYYTIEWQRLLGGSGDDSPASIVQATDGGYLVVGQVNTIGGDITCTDAPRTDIWLIKLSALGVTQWDKCLGGGDIDAAYSIINTPDGGYILTGSTSSNNRDVSGNHGDEDAWVVKLSATGSIQWQKCLGGSSSEALFSINLTNDGGYILAGRTVSNNGDVSGWHGGYDGWIVKLSSSGSIQWQRCLGGSYGEMMLSIIQTTDGGYIAAGYAESIDGDVMGNRGTGDGDIWVVKMSSLGVIQWQKCLGGFFSDRASKIIQTIDGGYLIAGSSSSSDGDITNANGYLDGWVVKISNQGVLQWQKSLGGRNDDVINGIIETHDGGYLAIGYMQSPESITGHIGSFDIWLVKFSFNPKTIAGRVEQANAQCQSIMPPQYLGNNTRVKVEKNNATYYTSTDSLGRFSVLTDIGLYKVSAIPPNYLWAACPPQTINILDPTLQDTTFINPNVARYLICPLMEVQLTTPFLRRCFESQYVINYANRGTAIQNDATAELTLDSALTYISATQPVRSRVGNKITFSLGNVGINQTGQFTVNVMVNCNSVLGQTHCSSVLIPKTMSCDTVQDSIPTIVNQCVAGCDSVAFLVSKPNTPLNKTFKYQLLADANLIDTGRFTLTNTFNLKRKRDGRTYRLEIRNPLTNQLLVARSVESTPTVTVPSVSTGFVNQFSQSIKQANIAENCTANRGAFDPNDKAAVPTGIGTRHFIEQGNVIEYLVQFQNTGTDTAFKVVVRDSLAAQFDWSTFKLNAQSHTATWQLNPQGVLVVTFNNINLVDSFTNEKASHGFFKYSIKLKDSIVTNTTITNRAAIYFDFNAPIITNLTTHTIGKEGVKSCLAKPAVTVNYSGCPSKNIVFTTIVKDAGTNPTYAWFRNSETTPLSINANFTLTNATRGTKIYCKTTASSDLCTETPVAISDTIVLNCIGVPTSELSVIQTFDVFPNPNKGVFTVKLNVAKPTKMQLNIFNYLGQTLKSETIEADNYAEIFDLSAMPNGIYVIKLTVDGRSMVKKVSVQ